MDDCCAEAGGLQLLQRRRMDDVKRYATRSVTSPGCSQTFHVTAAKGIYPSSDTFEVEVESPWVCADNLDDLTVGMTADDFGVHVHRS